MKEPPTDLDKCLAILVLRRADCSQDEVVSIVHCAKLKVGEVERWFTDQLSYSEAVKLCSDVAIKRVIVIDLVPEEEVDKKLLEKIAQITGDDIIRLYREADYMKAEEPDIESVVTQLKARLFIPPPETLLIDDFGGLGRHSIQFRRDVFKVVSKIGYDSEFWVTKEDWIPPGEIPPDLKIEVVVSPVALELSFPLEEHPLFKKLLSEVAREKASIRKKEGGRYLTMCRDIYREIRTEAKNRTFQSAWEDVLRIGRPPLTPNFGDLIYQLAVLHRSPSNVPIPDRELYQIRRRSLLFSELYLGLIHLANAPELPPIPPPPFDILDTWADLHRDMIRKWSASPAIIELLELFESLHGIEEAIKQELDDTIHGKQS